MNDLSAKQGMLCPICRIPLMLSERQGVEIDYCPQCRGVWLDRGELDKIIDRSELPNTREGVLTPSYDQRRDDKHSDHGYSRHHSRKRRKGFLADLFD